MHDFARRFTGAPLRPPSVSSDGRFASWWSSRLGPGSGWLGGLVLAAVLALSPGTGVRAVNLQALDANPLRLPEVGSYGLRILTASLLELTLVNTKDPDPAPVTQWNFVDSNFLFTPPAPSEFVVLTGDGQQIAVQTVGFKRRPWYAPLSRRDLRIANCLYLQLSSPLPANQTVEVKNPSGGLWQAPVQFAAGFDPLRWSPAVHVNQSGYGPSLPKKAMVGYYLGNLGELAVPNDFELIDASGATVFQGQLTRRLDQGYGYLPTPYQQVWQADFTAFTIPGVYRLLVPGLGTSFPFPVDDGTVAAFTRAYALGLYHQRCGTGNDLPWTRFVRGLCHTAPASVPDLTYTAVNAELAKMTGDYATSQTTAPQLRDVNASLYPFINLGPLDVSGGHHDAGDYSKYTINSAALIHYLVFAADAFPGAASLDNLGIPESGDGKSDLLQEAKWEADFLSKMQDADGGFYFLVYPRDREYESDVLPDHGDPQVVFPKTTSVTAAAVAALAEIGSSPLFKTQFPDRAVVYLEKAQAGWAFLTGAIEKYGKAGAYQKITHYGNEFGHDDELAWAAAALFAATGDPSYHEQLKAWFNPSDPNTWRWTWWRLFEGYGCACRTYAFAARTGRLPESLLDPVYLAQCEAQLKAVGDDQLRYAAENAYGTSFPDPYKDNRNAGWFFSSERAFDMTVAYQLTPRPELEDAVLSNLNYEGGCNPLNLTYVTGLGCRRQREIVNQYALNDRRVLPPSGLPLGNIQAGYQYMDNYKRELDEVTFPPDAITTAPYPYYDRWADSFNTTTEAVVVDQARSLASLAFWMAQSPVKTQSWSAAPSQIAGLPSASPADQPVTATLSVPGLDLSGARVVWEARDQEPFLGPVYTFTPGTMGTVWVEAEAQWPDGRRVVAATSLTASTPSTMPPNPDQSAPLSVSTDTVALFHLDQDTADATGRNGMLILSGNARLDTSNLGWMSTHAGAALRCDDLGDSALLSLPNLISPSGTGSSAMILEAMIYVDEFKGYNRASTSIVSLYQAWNAYLELGEDLYAGPYLRGGSQLELIGSGLTGVLTAKQWHHLSLMISQTAYTMKIDGTVVKQLASAELGNWSEAAGATLVLGNFAGWIDEVVVKNVHVKVSAKAVATPVVTPNGGSFSKSVAVTLATATPGATIRYTTDGTVPSSTSRIYSGAFTLTKSAVVRARAFKAGLTDSAMASVKFTIWSGKPN